MEYFEEDKNKSQAAAAMEAKGTEEFVPGKLTARSDQKMGQRETLDMIYGDGRPSKEFSYEGIQRDRGIRAADRIRETRQEESKTDPDKHLSAWNGTEIRDMLTSLLEELQGDRDVAKKQKAMADYATEERAQLFEEILREYI